MATFISMNILVPPSREVEESNRCERLHEYQMVQSVLITCPTTMRFPSQFRTGLANDGAGAKFQSKNRQHVTNYGFDDV